MKPSIYKKAARQLVKDTASHLGLEYSQLAKLYKQVKAFENGRERFSSCCLSLETDKGSSQLRSLLEASVGDLIIHAAPSTDTRYLYLYDTIQYLLSGKPEEWLTLSQGLTVPKVTAMEWNLLFGKEGYDLRYKCDVCGGRVKSTPSGYICDEGHGGTEVEVEDEIGTAVASIKEDSDSVIARVKDTVKATNMRPVPSYIDRPEVPWNDQQSRAFRQVFNWYKEKGRKPVFRLFGYAGTGKTTMAKEIAWNIVNGEQGMRKGDVLFAAYAGKAAARMREKGCAGAGTIHSLIYKPQIDERTGKSRGFFLNRESPLRNAALLIIDEGSMIDAEMAQDLLSFGVPILILGDPAQIQPIKGESYFTEATPDIMLTEIERQAEDNPIIWLATRARLKKTLKVGRYGDSILMKGREFSDGTVAKANQIIVGANNTRHYYNRRFREVAGFWEKDSQYPLKGETLMCLKNNKGNGLLNGTQWLLLDEPEFKPILKLRDHKNPLSGFVETEYRGMHFAVQSLDQVLADGSPMIVNTQCSEHMFDQNMPKPPWRDVANCDQFTFGYATTGHKAQGSEWDYVAAVDESFMFEQPERWLYTVITRAATRLRLRLH